LAVVLAIPEEVREYLNYNPDTGDLTWIKSPTNSVPKGSLAKRGESNRCFRISFKNKRYLAHRVIWFLMTGEQPTEVIDHIDRDSANNRWNNLRLSNKSENYYNSDRFDNAKGIYYDKSRDNYQVYFKKDGKRMIRRVETLDQAKLLREEMIKKNV
jgi:hypothetical protein